MSTPRPPQNVRIAHADGTSTPVEVAFLGTEPREVGGDIYIVERYKITTRAFLADGDHIEADWLPPVCSFVAMYVGVR